ncbi:MAG: dTMP kinase [Lachnospiraceae bacterium]|nr:dTMP kinase [Lachnospiraceae bacterium]
MQGIFISMEGPDGSGKSTQIELLKSYLESKGYDEIIITREPGGTVISEAIRGIILNKDYSEMGYMTEALLYASARAQLVSEVIKPALEADKAVISDRFVDSSAVYQGMARGLGVDVAYQINSYAIQGIMPQLTIHMDLPAKVGISRKKEQAELDRMELETLEFHEKVAEGYRTLAKLAPERIRTIDATMGIEDIHGKIVSYVEDILARA